MIGRLSNLSQAAPMLLVSRRSRRFPNMRRRHVLTHKQQGYVDPEVVEKTWRESFLYCYEHYDTFIFPMTIHPQVSGKAHIMRMHKR